MILNNLQWYRRMRGGRWALESLSRWVKVGPECAKPIVEDWSNAALDRWQLERAQSHIDNLCRLNRKLQNRSGIESELREQLAFAQEAMSQAYTVAEERREYIAVLEKRVSALRGEVERMKTRSAKKAGSQ